MIVLVSLEAEPELAMDLAAELRAAKNLPPLARLFAAAIMIGLAQTTSVVLGSLAGRQDVLPEFLYGPIDVLAKAMLLLLALVTAATGFTLVCPQAGGVRSPSTEAFTNRGGSRDCRGADMPRPGRSGGRRGLLRQTVADTRRGAARRGPPRLGRFPRSFASLKQLVGEFVALS